jgi:hypothetical protein
MYLAQDMEMDPTCGVDPLSALIGDRPPPGGQRARWLTLATMNHRPVLAIPALESITAVLQECVIARWDTRSRSAGVLGIPT